MQCKSTASWKRGWKVCHVPSHVKADKVQTLEAGQYLSVYEESDGWQWYQMIRVNGNEVDVRMTSGNFSSFSRNSVQVCHDNNEYESDHKKTKHDTNTSVSKETSNLDSYHRISRTKVRSFRLYTTLLTPNMNLEKNFYGQARMEEVSALLKLNILKLWREKETQGHRLYGYTFVYHLKPDGTKRSKFCIAAWNEQRDDPFTAAPTIRRISLRLGFAVTMIEVKPSRARRCECARNE